MRVARSTRWWSPRLLKRSGATYEPVITGESIESRIADLGMALRSPVIRGAQVELPGSFTEVYPRALRNLRLGEQVVVVGRLSANEPGEVKLKGELDGQPYTLTRAVKWTPEASRQNPLVPRLWSLARLSRFSKLRPMPRPSSRSSISPSSTT